MRKMWRGGMVCIVRCRDKKRQRIESEVGQMRDKLTDDAKVESSRNCASKRKLHRCSERDREKEE